MDPVTRVHNRRYYDTKARGPEKVCALALLNVDHFKDINCTYGRAVGDDILKRVAGTVSRDLREPDTLVRYYGDEFVVLFASIAPDELEARLKKICDDISALPVDGMGDGRHVTVSIGGAMGPDIPAELLKKADAMLRRARENRGTVEIWG